MGGGRGEVYTGFWWGNLMKRDHLEEDGKIMLNGSSGSGIWGIDWIDLAQDRYRWRALVNAIMNPRVP
jgi:hypothetical protein